MLANSCRSLPGLLRLTALLGAALLGAAAVPAEPAAAPTTAVGWITHSLEDSHFAIALPADWKVVAMDPALLEASLAEVGKVNPELGKAFAAPARSLVASGFKFLALDSTVDFAKVGFATNVNVLAEDLPAGAKIEEHLAANVAQLESLPAVEKLSQELITLDGQKAGRLSYQILVNPGSGMRVAITQVFALAHGKSLVFTFTTLLAQSTRYEPLFAQVISRIDLLD